MILEPYRDCFFCRNESLIGSIHRSLYHKYNDPQSSLQMMDSLAEPGKRKSQ